MNSARWDPFLLNACVIYLIIDAVNGWLLQQQLPGAGISVLYKSLILSAMIVSLWQSQRRLLMIMLLCLLLLLLGPLYALSQTGALAGFQYDINMAIKFLTPWLALAYGFEVAQRQPALFQLRLGLLMLISTVVLVFNLGLGAAGFGFSAYLPNDYFPDLNLGSKGFFKATNEISALLLVLCGFGFGWSWARSKLGYLAVLLVALGCASVLQTKTALLGVCLLALLVPLLTHGTRWWSQRWLWPLLFSGVFVGGLLLWHFSAQLVALLPAKFWLSYQQQGLLGMLLSSRDLYVVDNLTAAARYFGEGPAFFGIGHSGLSSYSSKPLAEIDIADAFVWFGVVGLALVLFWFCYVLRLSLLGLRRAPGPEVAGLFAVNLVLLAVSCIAGHVMTSGMLWIPWAFYNAGMLIWMPRSDSRVDASADLAATRD